MPRPRRLKKIKLPPLSRDLKEAIRKRFFSIAFLSILFIIFLAGARSFFYTSAYFNITSVDAKGVSENDRSFLKDKLLESYKGKNIFKVNLNEAAASLSARFPDAKDVIAKRALPDKLLIVVNFRKPVALLLDAKYFAVDREGYLLSHSAVSSSGALPAISGIDIKYNGRFIKKIESKNLKITLELLDEIKRSRLPPGYRLTTIEAGDIKNLSFYLNDILEIRIGYENFGQRLRLLKKTLKDPRFAVEKIRYIDLRFEDIVISPR